MSCGLRYSCALAVAPLDVDHRVLSLLVPHQCMARVVPSHTYASTYYCLITLLASLSACSHPPLAKMVLWLVATLTGYDWTKCDYEHISQAYGPECKYIVLRATTAGECIRLGLEKRIHRAARHHRRSVGWLVGWCSAHPRLLVRSKLDGFLTAWPCASQLPLHFPLAHPSICSSWPAMCVCLAAFSTGTCVLMYLIARKWGAGVYGGILASMLLVTDFLNLTEGRLILLDAQLMWWIMVRRSLILSRAVSNLLSVAVLVHL